jgi:energy-coupling factor transporter ATP-binding protein EcfA2
MATPIVHCRHVTYGYRDHLPVLNDLDLVIEEGEWVLLAGASGSGKSTLCRLLNGLVPHLHGGELRGDVVVHGLAVRATPPHVLSRSVGLLLQRPEAQCIATTVARDIAWGVAQQGVARDMVEARVREVVTLLDLTPLLQRAPHTLSGGELQRVALAGVLALQPTLLVLDEPFAFLDAAAAAQLRAILRDLHRQGVTILVAEHRLHEVVADATRMVVLDGGRVVADGAPRAVLEQNIGAWGLEPPPLVQLARTAFRNVVPLTLAEAVEIGLEPPQIDVPHPDRQGSAVAEWDGIWFARSGHTVLRDVNLASTAGTLTALLGANGAGKTTLLQHANGLLRPQRGVVRVLGRPVARRSVAELAREVGLVVQQPTHMLVAPTVRAELDVGPRALRRLDPAWQAEIVDRFALEPLLERVPQRLSAGEQRRVALAAILVTRPRALLLDEPTVGQDAGGRRALHDQLAACVHDGMAVLLATHDTEWALPCSTRWAVLAHGTIVADDQPAVVCQNTGVLAHAHVHLPAREALRHAWQTVEAKHG